MDNLGAKDLVMNLVNHGNSDVKMQALLAIQKMMVQNWWVWSGGWNLWVYFESNGWKGYIELGYYISGTIWQRVK